MDTHHDFQPRFVPLQPTKQSLTSSGGLATLLEAFDTSVLREKFIGCLPERLSNRSMGSYRLGLIQLGSFIYGHDCLADLDRFRRDPVLREVMKGETVAPRTMGDFLRDFEPAHLARLNKFLALQSWSYRGQLERMLKKEFKPRRAPHLSIDSTSHVQSGQKMEGLEFNYKGEWCLDSQVIFDELGLAWDFELRSGATKSGVGAPDQIRRAFSRYKFGDEKYLSGDAAYCNQDCIATSISLGVKFTFTANHATTGWENHLEDIMKWEPWEYTEEEKKYAIEHETQLPIVELGRFYWQPSWNENLRLPVVVKRTKTDEPTLFFGEWKYYGVVTNLPLLNWSLQGVIEHHNKRGNAENFIREEKYGYDLKHFPCLEMKPNHAYGLLAMVAHNLLRWTAINENPSRPKFAKRLRNDFIFVPGKMVSHARTLVLRVPEYFYQEVMRLREALQLKPYPAFSTS
jgi:hypothetical protein